MKININMLILAQSKELLKAIGYVKTHLQKTTKLVGRSGINIYIRLSLQKNRVTLLAHDQTFPYYQRIYNNSGKETKIEINDYRQKDG